MAKINPLETDVSFVSKLDNEPNDVGGLSPEELKATFDQAGNVLKEYINNVVVEAINTMKADEVAFDRSVEVPADTVQEAVETVRDQLKESVLGQVPDASIGLNKLAQEVLDRSYTKDETLSDATRAAYGVDDADPDDIFTQIKTRFDTSVKIAAGSYIGTGTYGESNPTGLTFDFEPKVLFVSGSSGTNWLVEPKVFVFGAETVLVDWYITSDNHYETPVRATVTWEGNTVSWYSDSQLESYAASYQLNRSGTTYHYVAFG